MSSRHISEHLCDIKMGNLERTLEFREDAALKHGYKNIKVSFQALAHIHLHPRGGNLDQMLLRSEAKWIFELKATKVQGLNEYISFNTFI